MAAAPQDGGGSLPPLLPLPSMFPSVAAAAAARPILQWRPETAAGAQRLKPRRANSIGSQFHNSPKIHD